MQRALRPVARHWYGRRYDVRVTGGEHVPTTGAVLVAGNHIGLLDGPLVAAYTPRPVHLLTKVEMFDGVMGRFLRSVGQIPLSRFEADPGGIKACIRVLRDGGVVGIFPEGGRGAGDLQRFRPGLAYLALVTAAPVVPVAILGTREPGGGLDSVPPAGSRLHLVYGRPLQVESRPWPRTPAVVRRATEQLHEHLLAHLAEALTDTGEKLPGPLPVADPAEAVP